MPSVENCSVDFVFFVLQAADGADDASAPSLPGTHRLRPVLMTAMTTVLGLVPMALGIGEGAELQKPMARVVIGGLLSSTMITLVLVPVIYAILEHRTHARRAASEAELDAMPHLQAGD